MNATKQFSKRFWLALVLLCFITGSFGFAADESQPTTSSENRSSQSVERLSKGFSNVVYGPLELIYQTKEEIKRKDPLRGLIPGLFKGIGWFVAREGVGLFQMVTFYLPGLGPELKDFDTDWLYA